MASRFDVLSKGRVTTRGSMNKSEARYADEVLEFGRASGKVVQWWFEPFSLRLSSPDAGQPARYTPDFMVLHCDGLTEIIDVKTASHFDDKASLVRIKCAAELYPLWKFRIVRPNKKIKGGWESQEV